MCSAIAARFGHTVALKTNGSVVAWGLGTYGQTTVPATLGTCVAIASGYNFTMAIQVDATDYDGDGIPAYLDNCPLAANPSQADCNGDGVGDACTPGNDCNLNGIPDSCDIASGADDDVNGNLIPDQCELDRGDLNLSGQVNAVDLAILLAFWGSQYPGVGDINHDGQAGGADLSVLLANWWY
ncbi:MAG: hypothetical protein EXS03_07650 [Phycisphaerales bacterium]|nr:hypothetical protein [Phycisphaerales bacterium]